MSSAVAAARVGVLSRPGPAVAAIAILALVLSCIGLGGRGLWLDELLSANFAAHGPWATLVTVLRFDVHPPLYYLQLSLWMLVGQGDGWLMANSMLWHAAAVMLLAHAAARLYGPRIGLAAALLLAVSPAALLYADQVRMYSFVMFLAIWAWYAQARWIEGTSGRFGAVWLILAQAAVAASHTAGLLMLSGIVVFGGIGVLATRRRYVIQRWLLAEVVVLVLSLPAIGIGMLRGVTHLRAPGLQDIVAVWQFLAGGGGDVAQFIPQLGPQIAPLAALLLGALVLVALFAGMLRDRRLVRPILLLLFLPLLLAALASHLAALSWSEAIFVPVIPFLCLGLARAALGGALSRQAGRAAVLALALLWGGIAVAGQTSRAKGDGYQPAAEAVRLAARPGDLVLVDGDFAYWCFLWSLAGPDWGDPRQAYILNADWDRLMRKLPEPMIELLDLGEDSRRLRALGISVALWDRREAPPAATGDILLLRPQSTAAVALPGRRLAETQGFAPLLLERWTAQP